MRLIDADEFREEMIGVGYDWESVLDMMPTVDAVLVVRCGECKHSEVIGKGLLRYCNHSVIPMIRDDDDYCSWGERRTE